MQNKPIPQLKRNSSWAESEYRRIHRIKAGMKYSFQQKIRFKLKKLQDLIGKLWMSKTM